MANRLQSIASVTPKQAAEQLLLRDLQQLKSARQAQIALFQIDYDYIKSLQKSLNYVNSSPFDIPTVIRLP